MQNVKQIGIDGAKYSVKAVNILKCHGKSILESQLINGYAIYTMRGAQGKFIHNLLRNANFCKKS